MRNSWCVARSRLTPGRPRKALAAGAAISVSGKEAPNSRGSISEPGIAMGYMVMSFSTRSTLVQQQTKAYNHITFMRLLLTKRHCCLIAHWQQQIVRRKHLRQRNTHIQALIALRLHSAALLFSRQSTIMPIAVYRKSI